MSEPDALLLEFYRLERMVRERDCDHDTSHGMENVTELQLGVRGWHAAESGNPVCMKCGKENP